MHPSDRKSTGRTVHKNNGVVSGEEFLVGEYTGMSRAPSKGK